MNGVFVKWGLLDSCCWPTGPTPSLCSFGKPYPGLDVGVDEVEVGFGVDDK